MRVVPEAEVKDVLTRFWSDVKTGGHRGINSFHLRRRQEFIGIKRDMVKKFLEANPIKQMSMATQERIVKPILTEAPNEHWEMDLIDMSQYARIKGNAKCHSCSTWSICLPNSHGPVR